MEPCREIVCETNGYCTVVRCGERRYPLGCKLGIRPAEPIGEVYRPSWTRLQSRRTAVDLSSHLPRVWDQGEAGSCTAQSLAAVIGGCYKADPSRLFLYFCGRAVGDQPTYEDTGCSLADAIKGVQLYGYCDEKVFPYSDKKIAVYPPYLAFKTAVRRKFPFESVRLREEDIIACLSEGFPIVLGIAVYPSMFDKKVIATGNVPTPDPKHEKLVGGHAITAVGYDLTQSKVLVRNSWGPDWGQKGYGWFDFAYLTNPKLAVDAYILRCTEQR